MPLQPPRASWGFRNRVKKECVERDFLEPFLNTPVFVHYLFIALASWGHPRHWLGLLVALILHTTAGAVFEVYVTWTVRL